MHDAREKSSRLLHVRHVIITETLRQLLFFRGGAYDEQNNHEATGEPNEPVRRCQRVGSNSQGERDVERMPDETVWATGDQRMVFSGHYSVREIGSQALERPDQQKSGHHTTFHTHPPEPQGQGQGRPSHS